MENFNANHGANGREKLEKDMREAARQLRAYDKHEYPYEWGIAADKWNSLYGKDTELGNKILREFGL